MNKEKQILDIAKIIGETNMASGSSKVHISFVIEVATKIYNAGYRKEERETKKCFNGECEDNLVNDGCCVNYSTCDSFMETYEQAEKYYI